MSVHPSLLRGSQIVPEPAIRRILAQWPAATAHTRDHMVTAANVT